MGDQCSEHCHAVRGGSGGWGVRRRPEDDANDGCCVNTDATEVNGVVRSVAEQSIEVVGLGLHAGHWIVKGYTGAEQDTEGGV